MEIVKESEKEEKNGVKYMIRGPHIDWGIITLQPGQKMNPHYHNEVEETFYVMEGAITFLLEGGKEVVAEKGTAIRLSPKESHGLRNDTSSVSKCIFIKHIYAPKDKVMVE